MVEAPMGPLSGVRIVDLTHVLNGPFGTLLLAYLGAEVLKVEHGDGDRFRHSWMPAGSTRDGYEFLAVNSNKKSITLNLKTARGKQLFRQLVAASDVVVENFTVGVMERLGLGYAALQEVNPRLIYAVTRGYGETGPNADVRSNASSNMAATGWQYAAQEMAGVPGAKVLGIGDHAAGISVALGVCAALYHRAQTGRGQKIEVSMQEALLGFMTQVFHAEFEHQKVGTPPKPCADGHYAFHLPDVSDDQWARLVEAMGRSELLADPRFATRGARKVHHADVEEVVAGWVGTRTRREIWDTLRPFGISGAPVLSLGEVLADPHLAARQAFVECEHPDAGRLKLLAPWIRFSETPSAITAPAPLLGQHNREVYGRLCGLDEAELATLQAEGVI